MVALACLAAAPLRADPGQLLEIDGDRVTARLVEVPPTRVLALVETATGAQVRGALTEQAKPVSVDFADVPLGEALARLLGGQNFTLVYADDGRLRRLTLLGGVSTEAVAAIEPPPPVVPPPPVAPSPHALLNRSVALPVGSRIAAHVGTPQATLQQLLEIALRDPDDTLRAEAMRAGLGGVEQQSDLRRSVTQALANVDDGTLRTLVESVAKDGARELVRHVSAATSIPEVRERSLVLLNAMERASPRAGR